MSSESVTLVLLLAQIYFSIANPIVQLPNGLINGQDTISFAKTHFYAFHGIPYAAPPVGDLRFKAPQPALNWEGTRDGTHMSTTCFQRSTDSDDESEDCLFINVYTPQLPDETNTSLLPVMVFIHGGGFVDGTGMDMAPDLFVDNQVVLASINYRLGVFGFISTQDEVIPGNNGLKDQQQALKWVHENIHLFSGDPEKVTIFGHSAGSASCAYQLLNQDNNGFFQGAILESGTFLSPWAFQRKSREIAFATAAFMDPSFKNSNDSQALLDFLMEVDAKDLDGAQVSYSQTGHSDQDIEIEQGFYYAPVVEVKNQDAFLTKKMYGLLKAGNVVKVPIMLGTTSEENIAFNPNPDDLKNTLQNFDENLRWVVPNDMEILDEANRTHMGALIRELYTGGEPLADHLGDGVRFSSDTSFTRSVIKHAQIFSKFAETFFYIFSYDGQMGNSDVHYDGAESVGHGEDLRYLLCSGNGCDDNSYPESDVATRKRMIKMWTDFAKFKNPTPEVLDLLQNVTWLSVKTDDGDLFYLDIGEDLVVKNHPKNETYGRWVELYDSLGYDDFDSY